MSRGNITRRGKHSWRIKLERESAIPGKRKVHYETVRGKRQDAEKRLTELLAQNDTGILADPSKITVAEHVRAWIRTAEVAPKTKERYSELCELQIVPHLGSTLLQKLRPAAIVAWHKVLLEKGGRGGTPLAPRTVGHAHRVLHAAIKDAVKAEILARNVVAVFSPPQVEDGEVEILEDDDVPIVLAKLASHPLGPIVATALGTGARRGELLALAWSHVDLDRATVHIERSLEQTRRTGGERGLNLRFKTPKTRAGHRTLSLPASVVAVLRDLKVRQMELRLQLGLGKLPDDALVFCRPDGSPIQPSYLSRSWARACYALDLPDVSFHALRHTHASALISSGMDVVAIAKRLGHKPPIMTLRIYAHAFAKLSKDAAAADAIEKVMRGSAK